MAPHFPRHSASSPLPPLRSARLLDQLRERICYDHYSLRSEQSYVHWVRRFGEMGDEEVEAFLAYLANARQLSPSHQLALCVVLNSSYVH